MNRILQSFSQRYNLAYLKRRKQVHLFILALIRLIKNKNNKKKKEQTFPKNRLEKKKKPNTNKKTAAVTLLSVNTDQKYFNGEDKIVLSQA